MTVTITFGKTPKTFKKFPVKFKTPEGEDAAIAITFKYRTRSGYAAYLNSMFAVDGEADKPVEGESPDFVALFAKGGAKSVEKLLEAIESWDFSEPLSKESLLQLQDEYPAAVAAMGEAYRMAAVDGKLGN